MPRLNIELDAEMHKKMKFAALTEDKTISQYIKDLLEKDFERLDKEEKKDE